MRSRSLLAALGAVAVVLLVPPLIGAAAGNQDATQLRGLKFLVPNAPGGGYDVTARTAAKAMEDAGVTGSVEVFNLPRGRGTVGLGRTVNESGDDRLVMSMGLGVVGSVFTNNSPATLADVTPIALLTQETLALLLAVDVIRGGHGEAEAGEDIDLAVPADKRTVGMLAGVLIATVLLIPIVGWHWPGWACSGAAYTLGSPAGKRPTRAGHRRADTAGEATRVRSAAAERLRSQLYGHRQSDGGADA